MSVRLDEEFTELMMPLCEAGCSSLERALKALKAAGEEGLPLVVSRV